MAVGLQHVLGSTQVAAILCVAPLGAMAGCPLSKGMPRTLLQTDPETVAAAQALEALNARGKVS